MDPNDILGPAGFGDQRWITDQDALPYTIRFENIADATAPAQTVVITHQLDADLDFRTFRLGNFGFGDERQSEDGSSAFLSRRIDLTSTQGFFVDVTATVDVVTGLATWTLRTIDPATGDLPSSGLSGFLPPNDETGIGEGFVSFTIQPRDTVQTGDTIDAVATITFDTQPPLDTPLWTNTLDVTAASSQVAPLPAITATPIFDVAWSGSDDLGGSAVAGFDVYVSEDGGPFARWLADTPLLAAPFVGQPGRQYDFYSRARDNAGNQEAAPLLPDATTVLTEGQVAVVGSRLFYNNSVWDDFDPAIGTADDPVTGAADDAAIAVDKQPLPAGGGQASFANYSSFSGGINGLMIDVAGLLATPTAADFQFRMGQDNDLENWTTAPAPDSITLRPGAGEGGSDRVSLRWADEAAIRNAWLEVTVKAFDGAAGLSGLSADEVFYFGNAIGETGNSTTDARVDYVDQTGTANNFGAAGITSSYDFNRDGVVDQADVSVVTSNFSGLTGDLNQDDRVGLVDLAVMQGVFGAAASGRGGDLSGDGVVSRRDLAQMIGKFGLSTSDELLGRRIELLSLASASGPPATSPAAASPAWAAAVDDVHGRPSSHENSGRIFTLRKRVVQNRAQRTSPVKLETSPKVTSRKIIRGGRRQATRATSVPQTMIAAIDLTLTDRM